MRYLYIVFCFFIGSFFFPIVSSGEDTDTQPGDLLVLKESFIRPEAPTANEKVEIKLIVKNVSQADKTVAGRLFVDSVATDESTLFVPSGGEGDFLLYFKPQSPKEYEVSVGLYEVIEDVYREIPGKFWKTDLLVGEEVIHGIILKIVGSIDLSPPFPDSGDNVEIVVEVENIGDEEARDVSIYFYEDGFSFDRTVFDIHAGDSAYVTAIWTADKGDSYIEVVVDPGGEVTSGGMNIRSARWITIR